MLKHPDFDPVAVHLGPLAVHWYGLMYLAGFGCAWYLAVRRCRRADSPLARQQVDDLIFYGAMGVVLGGRLGYALFYHFDRVLDDPLWLLRVWEGGMSFHGGLLGVVVAMLWYARRLGVDAGRLGDFVAPLVPLGLFFGRIGNFIGQELWGRPTDLPWAMVFPQDPLQLARHPSQLYQAALEGLALFALLWWFSSRPRPTWSVTGLFLAGYGVARFLVEFAREPDAHIGFDLLGWLTRGQLLSLPMIAAGLALLLWSCRRDRS
ncbi:MAG TPA: prolipoprotein diacylglyceryl transferase [Spongiibacteraceae bacterium]|jgi:phosphatidylglycerol:prolipoprotein diacylglycerol transferase|nr:prolipoprotein diacylglyceryl transferase [Spongiibacteraceae bacterium]HUH36962.1 prolipoprotein diacylglyceryl transferase [Spongiibacteraceae bacterium]